MKKNITVIFTCYNRKEKTVIAIKSLVEKNPLINFHFIVVDDKSTDGTVEAIEQLGIDCEIIKGTGCLYWCGGMRVGIERYFHKGYDSDCLLINDDVEFFDEAIEKMVRQLSGRNNTVIVGATCDKKGHFTYGLRIKRNKKDIWLNYVEPNHNEILGDTMNANCVLIPYEIMKTIGNLDSTYQHSLGDYDLGFRISRSGYHLISSDEYVGVCEENGYYNTWRDSNIPRTQRIKMKESPKGSPYKEWWHFLYKNYGLFKAVIYSITPYIKILIGR